MAMVNLVASSLHGASGALPQARQLQPIRYEALIEITDLGACRGCAGSLERALGSLSGVQSVVLESERPWLKLAIGSEHRLDLPVVRQTVRDRGYSSGRIRLRWEGAVGSSRGTLWPPWPARRPLPLLNGDSEEVLLEALPATVLFEAELHEEDGNLALSLVSASKQGSSH